MRFGLVLALLMVSVSVSAVAVCIDNVAPSAPGNLRVSGSVGSILLQWDASSDSPSCSGIAYYNVSRDGNWIGSVEGDVLSLIDNASLGEGEYSYTVNAVDMAGGNAGASIKNVIQVSHGGGSGGGSATSSYVCKPNWSCGEWSECAGEDMKRICEDLNECGTTYLRPNEVSSCDVEEEKSSSMDVIEPEIEEDKGLFSGITGAVVGAASTNKGVVTSTFILMMLFGFVAIRIKNKR